MPGVLMAMGRLNRPSLMVYGGTIRAGRSCLTNAPLDIEAAFQTFGAFSSGRITEEERIDIVRNACPGQGTKSIQNASLFHFRSLRRNVYSKYNVFCHRNAWNESALQFFDTCSGWFKDSGMQVSSFCAIQGKREMFSLAGEAVLNMMKMDLKPRDIMTRTAFENAITIVMALGGSTNAVLHLIAIAQ